MSTIIYSQYGDYLLPNIVLKEAPPESLTKYGLMRRSFLKKHRPISYSRLVLTETLFQHLIDTQNEASERMETLMEQLSTSDPPPDKGADGFVWTAHMNKLHHTAEEIILAEIIYADFSKKLIC